MTSNTQSIFPYAKNYNLVWRSHLTGRKMLYFSTLQAFCLKPISCVNKGCCCCCCIRNLTFKATCPFIYIDFNALGAVRTDFCRCQRKTQIHLICHVFFLLVFALFVYFVFLFFKLPTTPQQHHFLFSLNKWLTAHL